MAEVTNSSFIPKRTPTQGTRQVRRKNFFVFSIFSYALFVAAPIASGVVFIYEKYTDKIFNQAVLDLDTAIQNFSEADLERVIEFDSRLTNVEQILFNQISYNKVLQILENNTTAGVQFTSLSMTRLSGGSLSVSATVVSDTFDAVLFQKEIIQKISEATQASVTEFVYTPRTTTSENAASTGSASEESTFASPKSMQFKLRLSFPKEALVLATPAADVEVIDVVPPDSMVLPSASSTASSTGETADSIDTIDTPVTDSSGDIEVSSNGTTI